MRHSAFVIAVVACGLLGGCSQLERLTIIRPSAHIRSTTQVAPTYDVSGRHRRTTEDPYIMLASANDYYQRGKLDDAERLAEKARGMPGAAADANTMLAMIAARRGDKEKAGHYYEEATRSAPGRGLYANNYGTWLCANGRETESLGWFDRALGDRNYSTPVAALSNFGGCAYKAGDRVRAEKGWRTALQLDPDLVPALAGMARLEFEAGHHLEARAFLQRWLDRSPTDAAALRLAADNERKLGDNAAASRYLSRLQATSPAPAAVPPTQ